MRSTRCCPARWTCSAHSEKSIINSNPFAYMLFPKPSNLLIPIGLMIPIACGSPSAQTPQGPPPVNVSVQQVKEMKTSYHDEYPVIVKALNETELRAQVNGYITGV